MRGFSGECVKIEIFKIVIVPEFLENRCCLAFDVFWKTERIAAFQNADRSGLSSPIIDVLKEVMMDRLIVLEIQIACGEWLLRACV